MAADANQTILIIFATILILAGLAGLLHIVTTRTKQPEESLNTMQLVGSVVAVVFGGYLAIYVATTDFRSFEERLLSQAEERNRQLPRMLDENTRFDAVIVDGRIVQYRHTVVTRRADELDNNAFQSIMFEKLTKEQCKKEELVQMLRNDVVYRYSYFGKDGIPVSVVDISKVTCRLE